MQQPVNLSIIAISVIGMFNLSHAQIVRPVDKITTFQEDGFTTTLWSDDLKAQMYYVPYLQMDWEYFQKANPEFTNGFFDYCVNSPEMDEISILWKGKFHFWHDGLATNISQAWNTSNSNNVKYKKFFNNGKIAPENISIIPHDRLEIFLDFFFKNEDRYVDLYARGSKKENNNVTTLTGGEYLPKSIVIPFYASNKNICLWIENKEAPILQGVIYFDSVEKNRSSITASQSQETVEDLKTKIDEQVITEIIYNEVGKEGDNDSNKITALSKALWNAVTIGASTYGVTQGLDPATAASLKTMATGVGNAAIDAIADQLSDDTKYQLGDDLRVISIDGEKISNIKVSMQRNIDFTGSEQVMSRLLDQVDNFFEEARSSSVLTLNVSSMDGSLRLSANGEQLGSIPYDPSNGVDLDYDIFIVSKRSIEAAFSLTTDITLTGNDRIATSVPLPLRREDSIVKTAFERDVSARIQMVLDQVERELNQAESEVEQTTNMLRERLSDLLPQVDMMNSELTILKASASDALGAYEKKVSAIYTSAVGSIGQQLPIGSVIWWHPITAGEQVPEGWAIADGRTVVLSDGREFLTPNLMNRGIIGGSGARVGGAVGSNKVKLDGATEPHKLTVQEMPNHSHEFRVKGVERIGRTIAGTNSQNRGVDTSKTRSLRTMSLGGSQPHSHGLDLQFDNRAASMLLIPLIKL